MIAAFFNLGIGDGADGGGGRHAGAEEAAKIAEVPILACIKPPGIQDNHCTTALYMR